MNKKDLEAEVKRLQGKLNEHEAAHLEYKDRYKEAFAASKKLSAKVETLMGTKWSLGDIIVFDGPFSSIRNETAGVPYTVIAITESEYGYGCVVEDGGGIWSTQGTRQATPEEVEWLKEEKLSGEWQSSFTTVGDDKVREIQARIAKLDDIVKSQDQ